MTTVGEFTTEGILRGMADLYGAYGYMDAHGDVPFLASRLDEAGASLELLQSDLYSWEYVDGGDWTYDSPFSTTYEFYLFKLMAPEHDYTFLVLHVLDERQRGGVRSGDRGLGVGGRNVAAPGETQGPRTEGVCRRK